MLFLSSSIFLLTLTINSPKGVNADAQYCAQQTNNLHDENGGELYSLAKDMYHQYNQTCFDNELCVGVVDQNTMDFFEYLDPNHPSTPNHPIHGSATVEFKGFEEDSTFQKYKNVCEEKGGQLCRLDVELDLDGYALDLFNIDVEGEAHSAPYCLSKACEGEDPVDAFVEMIKRSMLEAAQGSSTTVLSPGQVALVESINYETGCAMSGLDKCILTIRGVDCFDLVNSRASTSDGGVPSGIEDLEAVVPDDFDASSGFTLNSNEFNVAMSVVVAAAVAIA